MATVCNENKSALTNQVETDFDGNQFHQSQLDFDVNQSQLGPSNWLSSQTDAPARLLHKKISNWCEFLLFCCWRFCDFRTGGGPFDFLSAFALCFTDISSVMFKQHVIVPVYIHLCFIETLSFKPQIWGYI